MPIPGGFVFTKFPCTICGQMISNAGAANFNHQRMHQRDPQKGMTMKKERYAIQFLVLHEVEVMEYDSIQAVIAARATLQPCVRGSVVYQRVLAEDTTIAADWDIPHELAFDTLQQELGLKPGDQITCNRA